MYVLAVNKDHLALGKAVQECVVVIVIDIAIDNSL